jgi:hypothetical protein
MKYIRENKDEWVEAVHESIAYLKIVANNSTMFV